MEAGSKCEIRVPEDVVFQILAWLPVASLLRFKSVCKSWLSQIDSPRFISQHTRCFLSDSNDNKLIVMNRASDSYFYFRINFISVSHLQLFKYIEFSPTDELHQSRHLFCGMIIASFDGVICLKHKSQTEDDGSFFDEDVVSLWNPATTHFTILPPGQSDIKVTDFGSRVHVVTEYGFGFDVQTNDYKVVRVISEYDMYEMESSFRSQVEVYSLSMGCWRIIDAVLPLNFFITHSPRQPFRNEIYCWAGYHQISLRSSILSFDFSKEAFGIMQVPDVCSDPGDGRLILAFLRGKIACIYWIHDYSEPQNDHCKIWVLNQYGVKESWTNPYTITLDQAGEPMGFSMDGNIILVKGDNEHRNLCLCDPLTQQVNEVSELPSQGYNAEAVVYKESLVSFKSATGVAKRVVYYDFSKTFEHLLGWGYGYESAALPSSSPFALAAAGHTGCPRCSRALRLSAFSSGEP